MFEKRTPPKKFFIIPFVVIFVISFVAFYFLLNQTEPTKRFLELFQNSIDLVRPTEICGNSDVITYLTYKNIPVEKRKNNKFGIYKVVPYLIAETKEHAEILKDWDN